MTLVGLGGYAAWAGPANPLVVGLLFVAAIAQVGAGVAPYLFPPPTLDPDRPPAVDLEVAAVGALAFPADAKVSIVVPDGAHPRTFPDAEGTVITVTVGEGAAAFAASNPTGQRWVGVTVDNIGTADVEITDVGWDLDVGIDVPIAWKFGGGGRPALPYRVLSHDGGQWFVRATDLHAKLIELDRQYPGVVVPDRVRGVAVTGSGLTFPGPWVPAVDLPIWASPEAYARAQAIARARTRPGP